MLTPEQGRRVDTVMAVTGMLLSVTAIASIVAPVPWQFRFAAVSIACLVGPGILGLRLAIPGDLLSCCVVGFALDVAVLMVLGQLMILVHAWLPEMVALLFLVATVIASWALLASARHARPNA
jgi:hypothetical protein